ncbi:sporulation protein YtfJ [Methanobrevibacter cuticularis]|uniref:Sporulation protein YtfJ n=1 Tax=Methanobrevibacter cuticularis TaxID=47311 RepID=A0A166EAN0_9EURY|nr:spore germination protein GerW family protein [Methanobrevibacter cuticularis]KZX16453.1 sporulation protein YtfJ [Methanobrevibacter cuticularis]
MSEENSIKVTVEELKKLLNAQNVVGEPIETQDKLLIPFMKLGFGFGVGQGGNDEGNGLGSAAVAGIEPISMVVINKKTGNSEGISVLNLSKGTETNKIISDLGLVVTDLVKEVINNMNDNATNEKNDIEESEIRDIE